MAKRPIYVIWITTPLRIGVRRRADLLTRSLANPVKISSTQAYGKMPAAPTKHSQNTFKPWGSIRIEEGLRNHCRPFVSVCVETQKKGAEAVTHSITKTSPGRILARASLLAPSVHGSLTIDQRFCVPNHIGAKNHPKSPPKPMIPQNIPIIYPARPRTGRFVPKTAGRQGDAVAWSRRGSGSNDAAGAAGGGLCEEHGC